MLHLNLKQNYLIITCLIEIRNIVITTHPYFFIKLYQALFFVDFKAINIDKKNSADGGNTSAPTTNATIQPTATKTNTNFIAVSRETPIETCKINTKNHQDTT